MRTWGRRTLTVAAVAAILVAGSACQSREQKLQKHLDRAAAGMEAGELETARIELLNALRIDPASSRAYFLLGQTLMEMKDYTGAVRALSSANELTPADREIAYTFGNLLFAGRAYSWAESVAGQWLQVHPDDGEFLYLLSQAQAQQGEVAAAVEAAERAARLSPDSERPWINLAQVHLILGDYAAANAALANAERIDPGSVNVTLTRVDMLARQGRMEEASRSLEEAVDRNPDRLDLKTHLGKMYETLGRTGDALAVYRDVSSRQPSGPVFHRIGLLHYTAGEKEEAVRAWSRGIEVDPYFVELRLSLAGYHAAEQDLETARRIVDEALGIAPGHPEVLALRGKLKLAEGEAAEAAVDLQKALDGRPDLMEARLLLAQAQLRTGETASAKNNINRFLEKNPDNVQGSLILARLEAAEGNLAASSRHALLASRDPSLGREALWILGDNALKQRRVQEAGGYYQRNLDRHGTHPGTLFRLARSRELLDDPAAAEAGYRQLVRDHPDFILPLANLVNLLLRTGRPEEALTVASSLAGQGGAAQRLLYGRLLAGTGKVEEARDVYLDMTGDFPDMLEPYQRTVDLYARESDLAGAETWLADSLARLDPPPVRLLVLLGMVRDSLGKKEEAVATYRQILDSDPDFVPALNNLAWNLAESGQLEEALKIANRASKLAPDDPFVSDTYAWVLHRWGNPAAALPLLRRAAEALPGNRTIGRHLVEVLEAVGRVEEADQRRRALAAEEAESGSN